jgi:hypothetical protein
MGELTTQNQSPVSAWLDRIDTTRNELINAARNGSRVNAAFAMAEARVALIESLKDEQIRARLLRITDPTIHMVELANNPTDEDRIRVCAIAILSGFCPGDDQFAIFGGKTGGKLYTKEAGFRTLFAHLGIVPELSVGHPEFVPLGNSGKKIWRVSGKASCEYGGKTYAVEFAGPSSLGLPGYESDNVAGITAKARRQILKSLWAKVSPILNDDHADEPEIVATAEPVAITQQTEQKTVGQFALDRETEGKVFEQTKLGIQRRVKDEQQLGSIMAYWDEIAKATNKDQLRLLYDDINKTQVKPLGKNNVDELLRWCKWCAEGIIEAEGGAA